MRHFIYTFSESEPPDDGSGVTYTAEVYSIEDNKVSPVGTTSGSFTTEAQLVVSFLERKELLPKGSSQNFWRLEKEGIATITRV